MLRQDIVSDTETRIVVSGPLYGEAGVEFERKMDSLSESVYRTITLDFSMAVGITSSAIAKLVFIQKRLAAQGRSVRIRGCSEVLYSIFTKIRLDTLIEITK